jgi:hypothetical protein
MLIKSKPCFGQTQKNEQLAARFSFPPDSLPTTSEDCCPCSKTLISGILK